MRQQRIEQGARENYAEALQELKTRATAAKFEQLAEKLKKRADDFARAREEASARIITGFIRTTTERNTAKRLRDDSDRVYRDMMKIQKAIEGQITKVAQAEKKIDQMMKDMDFQNITDLEGNARGRAALRSLQNYRSKLDQLISTQEDKSRELDQYRAELDKLLSKSLPSLQPPPLQSPPLQPPTTTTPTPPRRRGVEETKESLPAEDIQDIRNDAETTYNDNKGEDPPNPILIPLTDLPDRGLAGFLIYAQRIGELAQADNNARWDEYARILTLRLVDEQGNRRRAGETQGSGVRYGNTSILKTRHRRVVGRGISSDENERYIGFGKYLLHVPSLKRGILNLKFPSFASIPTLKQTPLSRDLLELISDLIETNELNKRLYSRMSQEDQDYFYTIAQKAEIDQTLGMGIRVNETHRKEMERFTLLRGQIIAGNNNPEVLREMKQYIVKFMRDGTMNKHQGTDLLFEISCLS
jgi:hypothetical protein